MSIPFANYHKQRAAFGALFADDCCSRILLLKGGSGSGKTSLLKTCLSEAATGRQPVSVQLRDSAVGVTEIFSRSAQRIGWEKLSQFSQCAQKLAAHTPHLHVTGVDQKGETNNLSIALNVNTLSERESRQTQLTDAWFADVEKLGEPLVMVFDVYEEASSEVKNWLSGPFLSRTADCAAVRVAIAGQSVPDVGIEWNHCHTLHELFGISDAREWLPVVAALGKKVPVEPAEIWLGGICYSHKGDPSAIMKVINTFPDACSLMPEGNRQ